jgi:hypothetical protein
MRYLLKFKDDADQVTREMEFSSLTQISNFLGVTYCCVRKNLEYSLDPSMKKGRKLSQVMFDHQYSVCVADHRLREKDI